MYRRIEYLLTVSFLVVGISLCGTEYYWTVGWVGKMRRKLKQLSISVSRSFAETKETERKVSWLKYVSYFLTFFPFMHSNLILDMSLCVQSTIVHDLPYKDRYFEKIDGIQVRKASD